ncbi:hypothetical protein ABFS83_11G104100 [Erythranthe nasuta]
MLTDDRWREIQYAVEYAVFAIADPTPRPDPPGQRWVQRKEEILDEQPQRIAAPIPVPRDWKPAHPLLQEMAKKHSISQLRERIDRLHNTVIENIYVRRPVGRPIRSLGTAQRYLLKSKRYLSKAYY